MTDLSFVENYKKIRARLNSPLKKKVAVPVAEEVVPVKTEPTYTPPENITSLKVMKDAELRAYLRKSTVLEDGISYRQALLKGAEDIPKRIKLYLLPILEEANYSWEELFSKDPKTKRNSRAAEAVKTKWAIFREMHDFLGMNPYQIARVCRMDHTSIMYGLGKLEKRRAGKDGKHKQSA